MSNLSDLTKPQRRAVEVLRGRGWLPPASAAALLWPGSNHRANARNASLLLWRIKDKHPSLVTVQGPLTGALQFRVWTVPAPIGSAVLA